MTTKRIGEYIDYKGISYYAFENFLGVSRGSISKAVKENKSIGSNVLENILTVYPDMNPAWLLTGTGSMLKQCDGAQKVPQVSTLSTENALREIIREKDRRIETLAKTVGRLEHEIEELKKGSPYDDDDIEDAEGVACADVG